MNLKTLFQLLKETFNEWNEDKAPRLGAALAYYSVFSIAPLLIIAIAIAGQVFGETAANDRIRGEIADTIGPQAAELIQETIKNSRDLGSGIFAVLVGVVVLLFGASGVFGQLQDALNTIWKVTPKPGLGLWGFLKDRFLSFTMVLGTGFLLLLSLLISAALAALTHFVTPNAWANGWLLEALNFVISFGSIMGLFTMIYKVLPDAEISWSDVWIGAGVTTLLFMLGKLLIGLYLGRSSVGSAYGAAGSLVVVLLWVYYSSQILLFGAEFTRVYANHCGKRVVPSANAVAVTQEVRDRQGMPRPLDVAAHNPNKPAAPTLRTNQGDFPGCTELPKRRHADAEGFQPPR
jgi:membrane protein